MNFIDLSDPDFLGHKIPYILRRFTMFFLRLIINLPLLIYEIIKLCKLIKIINPKIIHINSGGFSSFFINKGDDHFSKN